MSTVDDGLLYRNQSAVKIGEVERYIITYKPPQKSYTSKGGQAYSSLDQSSIYLKVRNCESLTKRAAYLMGPYILYVDVRPFEYTHKMPCYITADQPQFEPNLQPAQSFNVELSCHTIKDRYIWIVDIASQMLFSSKTKVEFEFAVGRLSSAVNNIKTTEKGIFDGNNIHVLRMDTTDIWNLPPPVSQKPVHLVVLTHGLHSNVGADMLYIKDQIEQAAAISGENLIVRGYHSNVCRTERGIKYLGMKVAEYIVNDVYNVVPNIKKISFIAHSLGGLIQTFAIAYIKNNFPWFFKNVTPVNFITLASPLLGISHIDSPGYVKAALSFGAIGRTGQELSLIPTEIDGKKTLLELLPTGTTHKVLKSFRNRTVYANAVNDGIVPLRTSALLFLDYKGLRKVAEVLKYGSESSSKTSSEKEGEEQSLKNTDSKNAIRNEDPLYPLSLVAEKLSKRLYNIPEFMSSMPFIYSSNPVISVNSENANASPESKARISIDSVSETLKHQENMPVSDGDNVSNISKDKNQETDLETKQDDDSQVGIIGKFISNSAPNNIPKDYEDIKGPNSNVGQIPSEKSAGSNFQFFLTPIQNALASWVAPQGTKKKVDGDDNDNPLPKASVIDSARSILLPQLPPKQYLIEPNDRANPIIHDKVYTNEDIHKFKKNRRASINGANQEDDGSSALNPFADNFSTFFNTKSNTEKLEEKIAMEWHDEMPWRKVLVNVRPDAHNNIIVRRRFSNAYGWLVIDHLIKAHFSKDALTNTKITGVAKDCMILSSEGEENKENNATQNKVKGKENKNETDDDAYSVDEDSGDDEESDEDYTNYANTGNSNVGASNYTNELEVPKVTHLRQSPKLDHSESYRELDSILAKDVLLRENTAYNYSPNLAAEGKGFKKENHGKNKKKTKANHDWINMKNYNEDSIFEVGPTGFLSNVNDKISKII